jgi:anti-sigma factor RsiW
MADVARGSSGIERHRFASLDHASAPSSTTSLSHSSFSQMRVLQASLRRMVSSAWLHFVSHVFTLPRLDRRARLSAHVARSSRGIPSIVIGVLNTSNVPSTRNVVDHDAQSAL